MTFSFPLAALMVGSVYKSHGKSYRYYICPNHKGGGCSTKNIRALYVENFVVSHLINNLFKRSMIGDYNELIAKTNSSTSCAGFNKVCVYVDSEAELLDIARIATEKGILTAIITDAGMTEFHGIPTKTCLALEPLPCDIADELTGHLNLY